MFYNQNLFYRIFLAKNITSTYSGAITVYNPVYFVKRNDRNIYEEMTYRYTKIPVIITTYGLYRFECNVNNFPHFVYIGTIDLYTNSFNSTDLSINRLTYKYAGEGIHKNYFGVLLRFGRYILVVSIIDTYEQSFSVSITGPEIVTFS